MALSLRAIYHHFGRFWVHFEGFWLHFGPFWVDFGSFFGEFWPTHRGMPTSTRTVLHPQAPHRTRTHTHHTPTTPRPACACARPLHAAFSGESISILALEITMYARRTRDVGETLVRHPRDIRETYGLFWILG